MGAPRRTDVRLQAAPFEPAEELRRLEAMAGAGAGGLVVFVGKVRDTTKSMDDGGDGSVETLRLDAHPTLTLQAMRAFTDEAAARAPIIALSVVHRWGAMSPGEPIVFVGAAAAGRRAAFEAADALMDRLKTEAPFWKMETRRMDGRLVDAWIEPTADDYADAARWRADLTGDLTGDVA